MICANTSDFIDHPLPKHFVSAHEAFHHLNLALIRPWAEIRLAQPTLSLGIREAVKMTFLHLAIISRPPVPAKLPKPKRCNIFPWTRDRNKSAAGATSPCARIMPHLCVYALTAILQVRQVASFYSQHGICVVLLMLLANNRVWILERKTYNHRDFLQSANI